MSNRERAVLKIEQKGPVIARDNGIHYWGIKWELSTGSKDFPVTEDIRLLEPLTPGAYDEVAEYLDEALDDPIFDQADANEQSKRVDRYRRELFKRLRLSRIINAVHGRILEIHIWPDKDQESGRRSVHSIQWEQLEALCLWSKGKIGSQQRVRSVTVCRHVRVDDSIRTGSVGALQAARQSQSGVFDVLLVVARPHVHDSPDETRRMFSVLNPATIRSVLLQLQEELKSNDSTQSIRLEIVRPGCLKELRDHLKKRTMLYKGHRPYHIVHFDMHGGVNNDGKAFLEFNEYTRESSRLVTTPIAAKDVACLLSENNVDCVILSVCKSAVAHEGPSANLSSIFLKRGISAILAMSHNMHDSISKRFFAVFYREIFVESASLQTAASKARKGLFDDRLRWSYSKGRRVSIQDWFIPVLYTSSDEAYRLSYNLAWYLRPPFVISTQLEWLFLVVWIVIYLFPSDQLCAWIGHRGEYCPNHPRLPSVSPLRLLYGSPPYLIFVRKVFRLRRYWQIRQRLSVLAEDRQNALRIEADLIKTKMIFIHNEEDVEDDASPFINCLAVIWECTHFAVFRGAIEAERFLQPGDLTSNDHWRLWVKACTNFVWLLVHDLWDRRFIFTKEAKSLIIIENVDSLYLEKEELRDKECYALAQQRLEVWLQEQLTNQNNRVSPPYLMLTARHREALGDDVPKWLKDGPGRLGLLDSIVVTTFVRTSQAHIDPTNSSFDERKWYDWSMSWISGNVTRR